MICTFFTWRDLVHDFLLGLCLSPTLPRPVSISRRECVMANVAVDVDVGGRLHVGVCVSVCIHKYTYVSFYICGYARVPKYVCVHKQILFVMNVDINMTWPSSTANLHLAVSSSLRLSTSSRRSSFFCPSRLSLSVSVVWLLLLSLCLSLSLLCLSLWHDHIEIHMYIII